MRALSLRLVPSSGLDVPQAKNQLGPGPRKENMQMDAKANRKKRRMRKKNENPSRKFQV